MRIHGGAGIVALALVMAVPWSVSGATDACADEYRTCLDDARREGGTDRDRQCAYDYVECQAQRVAAR